MCKVSEVLTKLSDFEGFTDLFYIVKDGKYQGFCSSTKPFEGLVVDTLAYYDRSEKIIVLCEDLIEDFIRRYEIDTVECCEAFVLYVLLHEHVHYITDIVGFLGQFSYLSKSIRFDEPFCEYIALKSIATGTYRVFGYEKCLKIPFSMQECVPFIATLYRPYPYSLFRELYAIPSEVFGIKAENILLSLARKASKLKVLFRNQITNPEPMSLLRLALLTGLNKKVETKVETVDILTLNKATPVKVMLA